MLDYFFLLFTLLLLLWSWGAITSGHCIYLIVLEIIWSDIHLAAADWHVRRVLLSRR